MYHIASLDIGSKAELLFRGPSDLVIQGRMKTGHKSVLGPAGGSSVTAADIRIYVSGTNHPDRESPLADIRQQRQVPRAAQGQTFMRRTGRFT